MSGSARCGLRRGFTADGLARGPRSAGAPEQGQVHGVGAVQMRPQLDVGAVAQAVRPAAAAGRRRVRSPGPLLEHVVDDRPGLGEVRRAGRVADDPADPYGLQRGPQQRALERGEALQVLGPPPPAGLGPPAQGARAPCRARPSAPGRRRRAARADGSRRRRSPGTGPGLPCQRLGDQPRPVRLLLGGEQHGPALGGERGEQRGLAAGPGAPVEPAPCRAPPAGALARASATSWLPSSCTPARPSRTASTAPGSPPSVSRTAYGDQRPGTAASSPAAAPRWWTGRAGRRG